MLNLNQNNLQQEQSLIFLHIPKAAGTTLYKIIDKQYDQNAVFTIGINSPAEIEKFKSFTEDERQKIKVLKGHMTFGLHEFMPQPCTYISILREPVDRVISSYYYILRAPVHYLHDYVTSKKMSLSEFIASGILTDLDNGQTRRLAGVSVGRLSGDRNIDFGNCSSELLERAKENIHKHFSVVGISARFDEFLLLTQKRFGWGNCYYLRENVTPKRPLVETISDETLEIINKYNQLDIELYEFVCFLFEEMLVAQLLNKDDGLKKFQKFNNIYSNYIYIYRNISQATNKIKANMKILLKNFS